ncbi:MAG: hypothetical protein NPIRA04_26870 [Nitrospirales bacterium]|nr:MAG: hypothetical protein NPIRA04_26870 [Nitrospirales bacterium]
MKIVALFLFVGCTLSGCFTLTPGEKAYNACLETVPEDINQAAEGESDMYQERPQTALTKDSPDSSPDIIVGQPRCSSSCQAAREEQHRIVSECYLQWQKIHHPLSAETEAMPDN